MNKFDIDRNGTLEGNELTELLKEVLIKHQ